MPQIIRQRRLAVRVFVLRFLVLDLGGGQNVLGAARGAASSGVPWQRATAPASRCASVISQLESDFWRSALLYAISTRTSFTAIISTGTNQNVITMSHRLNQRFLCLHAIHCLHAWRMASLETTAADGV